ncbi:hypothetical protein JCM10908_005413 [Rhodotorula pacifica]|uniref:uncharacterized protein n=1 Tax=Rhodotorula pacifica TaxID=1495444 RepID=UPI00316C8AD8
MIGKAPLAGPASGAPLETSNSRLSLSLQIPPPGTACYPGQTLHPVVRFKGDTKYEKLSLRLHAETPLRIWGKDRWQAGAIASATMGGGGGVPVTSLERQVFIEQEIPFTSSARHSVGDTKKHGSAESGPEDGVYEFVLPSPPEGQLLPSLVAEGGMADGGYCSVVWSLELEGTRHGWYKSNDKLSLVLPVVIPIRPPPHPLEAQTLKSLKYQGRSDQTLSVGARLVCDPPTHANATLRYRVSLTPTDSVSRAVLDSALSSDSASPIKPMATLARQVRTAPKRPENGQDFNWAAVRVVGGTLERESRSAGHKAGDGTANSSLDWAGELTVPAGHHTIRSQNLDVNYILNCHLRSAIFPDGDLHLSLVVPLPSVPAELADLGSTDPEAEGPVASGSALPPYAP